MFSRFLFVCFYINNAARIFSYLSFDVHNVRMSPSLFGGSWFDLLSYLFLAFLMICCVLQEVDPTGCMLLALVSAGFVEWEAVRRVGCVWRMLEGHGREKSGIIPPLS